MKTAIAILMIAWIAQLGVSDSAGAQELKRIRIGYPSLSFRQSNVWVAKEQGLFRKYGLEVEPIFLRGGQVATQALAAGDPPIVNIGTVVQAGLQGYPLVLVAAVETKYDQIVFARKGITRLEDLRGKNFGISGFGAATHHAANILFKHLGIEPGKEVALVPGGPDAERLAALASGKIDATFFTSSAAAPARRAGFVELFQVADLEVEVQGNGFATSRSYIANNRGTVKNALRGFVEAIYYIFANKKEAQ
jgi:NitT/TauT family transport system substrate-binding protein